MVLPAEVRNEIYRLCLQEPTDPLNVILNEKAKVKLKTKLRPISPQILATSKQIYAEALPILYRENQVYFTGVGITEGFMKQIAINNICMVEVVSIWGTVNWTQEHLNRLTRCVLAMPGLRAFSLTILVNRSMLR